MADTARPYAVSLTGFFLGAAAFALVVIQFVAGPFAPQETVTLGELAGSMARDAVDGFLGRADEQAVAANPWDIDRVLLVAAMVTAVVGIVLGVIGLIRHEMPRAVSAALVMGGAAVAAQFFATTLLMVLCIFLTLGLLAMIGQFFGDIGLGGFGG